MDINQYAEFTWLWDNEFFVETEDENYIWSCPDYPGGDDTMWMTRLTLDEYCTLRGIGFGRCKGRHRIVDYCGVNFTVLNHMEDRHGV